MYKKYEGYMSIFLNHLKRFFVVSKKFGIVLLAYNHGKPKLYKRMYGEEILKNAKEPIFRSKK